MIPVMVDRIYQLKIGHCKYVVEDVAKVTLQAHS